MNADHDQIDLKYFRNCFPAFSNPAMHFKFIEIAGQKEKFNFRITSVLKPLHSSEISLRIPFHDVDLMEVVWHGHYIKYFEIARCALLDRIDYNYAAMRESGYAWPIIDLRVRYVKPAVFGQNVTVTAKIVEWENRLKIDYLITDALTGARLAKGHTIQVAVNMQNKEMCLESPTVLFQKLGVKSS